MIARIPCFLEFDLEVGRLHSSDKPNEVIAPITWTRKGRIVTEDGTWLVQFDLAED